MKKYINFFSLKKKIENKFKKGDRVKILIHCGTSSFPLKDREIDISKIKNDKYGFVILIKVFILQYG